jgi:NAD(P)H dehydrogenase (quinone)
MRALVVLAHPEMRSINAGLAQVAEDTLTATGYAVERSNLVQMGFDPVERAALYPRLKNPSRFDAQTEQRHAVESGTLAPDVAAEIEKIRRADFLFIQCPIWWFSVPAVLKGWFDRALVYGGLYDSTNRYDRGLLKGKRAMMSVTTGGPESTFAHNGRNGDIELLMWPMNMTLAYVGYTVLPHAVAYEAGGGIAYSTEAEAALRRERDKTALAARLRALATTAPLRFNGWGDWDEKGQLKPGVEGYSHFMRARP